LLVNHIKKFQEIPAFSSSRVILIVESNWGWEAFRLAQRLKLDSSLRNIVIMNEDHDKPGVRMSHLFKKELVACFEVILDRGLCSFSNQFFCVHEKSDKNEIKDLLVRELKGFSRKLIFKQNAMEPKEILSGKMDGKDDLVICLMLLNRMARIFLSNQKYKSNW
jgi:hypothetical protein